MEKDPIMILEELAVSRRARAPVYELVEHGKQRRKKIMYQVEAFNVLAFGRGASAELAKSAAAKNMLEQLYCTGIYNPHASSIPDLLNQPVKSNKEIEHKFCEINDELQSQSAMDTSLCNSSPTRAAADEKNDSAAPLNQSDPEQGASTEENNPDGNMGCDSFLKAIMEKKGITMDELKEYVSDEFTQENFDNMLKKLDLTKSFIVLGNATVLSLWANPLLSTGIGHGKDQAEAEHEAKKNAYFNIISWMK